MKSVEIPGMLAYLLVISLALIPVVSAEDEANLTLIESPNEGSSNFVIPVPVLQQLCPRGLRIWISDSDDIRFVAFHISVNKPLKGPTPSEYTTDLGRPMNGRWQYDLPDLYLQKGDEVYYWMLVVHNGVSHLSTDHSWKIPGTPCTGANSSDFHCQPSATVSPNGQVCAGQLLFEDEFNNFNLDIWEHEISASGGKHNEFQMYVNQRSNSFVRDGVLHLRPTLTQDEYGDEFLYNGLLDLRGSSLPGERCTNPSNNGCYKRATGAQIINPIMSAGLRTAETFSFQYGVVKIRAKMPRGDWLWPALYLLPHRSAYGEWPRSGQVTVAESRGNAEYSLAGEPMGVQRVEMALQFAKEKQTSSELRSHLNAEQGSSWNEAFHDYELEWTEEHILFKVDGKEVNKVVPPAAGGFWAVGNPDKDPDSVDNIYRFGTKIAPFDHPFYLTVSLAIGGTSSFFPDVADDNPYPKPWNNTSPHAMLDFWERRDEWFPSWQTGESDFQVDYIRVWALP